MASSYATVKKIDHLVGLPLCVLLSFLYGLRNLIFGRPRPPRPPRRVLLIKFFGMGSIGYSTVIARDLKREFPEVHLTLLTFAENQSFARFLGVFDAVEGIDRNRPLSFVIQTLGTFLRHLRRPYDVVIDLEFFSKYTTIHTALTRAPQRIGFYGYGFWRRHIYTDHSFFNIAKHVRGIYGLVAKVAGAESSEEMPVSVKPTDEHLAAVDQKLRDFGWDGKRTLVGVNVNASDLALGRRWPVERFAELVDDLAADGCFVCLTGAPGERDFVAECFDRLQPASQRAVVNAAGELSLFEFIALLCRLRLFITNDSGPMILAVLADCPSVSLWGPGDPLMFGGAAPRHTYLYSGYPCSPCMYVPMTDAGYFCNHEFPCVPTITLDQVRDEVRRRLAEADA